MSAVPMLCPHAMSGVPMPWAVSPAPAQGGAMMGAPAGAGAGAGAVSACKPQTSPTHFAAEAPDAPSKSPVRFANDVYYLIRCDETVLILQRQLTVLLEIIKELLDNYGEGSDSQKTHKPCNCNQHQSQRLFPGNNLNIHFIH